MVWPIPFLINMFIALKGSRFYFYSLLSYVVLCHNILDTPSPPPPTTTQIAAKRSRCFKHLLTSCQKDEFDISCPIFVSTLKCTSSPHIPLIGHSTTKLTDVDFSFQKFHCCLKIIEQTKVIVWQLLVIIKK